MELNYQDISKQLLVQFPPIDCAFAYGSAAFKQEGVDYQKEQPLLDLIFIVNDISEFHEINLKQNPHHYSGLGYLLGSKYLSFLQDQLMPVHFNPFINLQLSDNSVQKIKYGVIDYRDFLVDLEAWETLLLAGRTQKPIKILFNQNPLNSKAITNALERNRICAVAASILLNQNHNFLNEKSFYQQIVLISYMNDIRFKFKTEKSNKVEIIVDGQFQRLKEIYLKIITTHYKGLIDYDESNKIIKYDVQGENKLKFLNNLPINIQIKFGSPSFQDYIQLQPYQQEKELLQQIQLLNQTNSKRLLMHHALTVSPIKNFMYVLQKFKKGRKI